ncbi:MAG: hypothetical protein JXQ87_11970 [Bacteroidia bacterium]
MKTYHIIILLVFIAFRSNGQRNVPLENTTKLNSIGGNLFMLPVDGDYGVVLGMSVFYKRMPERRFFLTPQARLGMFSDGYDRVDYAAIGVAAGIGFKYFTTELNLEGAIGLTTFGEKRVALFPLPTLVFTTKPIFNRLYFQFYAPIPVRPYAIISGSFGYRF